MCGGGGGRGGGGVNMINLPLSFCLNNGLRNTIY